MVASKARGKAAKAKPRAKTVKAKKGKRKGAGRPEIEITAEQRERVEILIGGGMGIDETAAAMSMAPNTFKKHFGTEIRLARSKKRAEVISAMFKSAVGGNVSAQKTYIQLNALADADDVALNPPVDAPARAAAPSPAAKALKLGKKEIAQEEALTAAEGTAWGADLDVTTPPGAKPN